MGNFCGLCQEKEKNKERGQRLTVPDTKQTSIQFQNETLPQTPTQNPTQNLTQNLIKDHDLTKTSVNAKPEGNPFVRPATPPMTYSEDPSKYKTASRDELAAAAERRLAKQKNKNEAKTVRPTSTELQGPSNTGKGGLKWKVG